MPTLKTILTFVVLYLLFSLFWRMIFKKSKPKKQQQKTTHRRRTTINQQPKYNVQAEDIEFEEIKE